MKGENGGREESAREPENQRAREKNSRCERGCDGCDAGDGWAAAGVSIFPSAPLCLSLPHQHHFSGFDITPGADQI